MSDILITEFMDEDAVTSLRDAFEVHYDPDLHESPAEIAVLCASPRALIVRNRTLVDTRLLDAAPHLVAIGRLGVGLDNIDTDACAERGISVYPATGANVVAVAEYVIAAILIMLRGAFHARDRMRAGHWPRNDLVGCEASGKVLGIVGFGAIGRAVAERANALGMEIVAFDPFLAANDDAWQGAHLRRVDSLPALLEVSDVISLHIPLTQATAHLIGAHEMAAMKPGAYLVNTARGGVIDEKALIGALTSGRIGGATLDVFEDEPLTADSPLIEAPGLYLTPHIAGLTCEAGVRVGSLIAKRIRGALA
ncbi:MAG: hydroxyacid dehydrogenase [Ectothiorhodospiraceae bacterium AqS1]|nr:hydroxyacid dehydrogenase [Ectothiorhodospiraceae bacterium AqS1]